VRAGGPREVRRVGGAINDLADEADRGRAVEAAIQTQLREVDAAKSDFVSNVSHELRTPLTIITGYLELLEEELAGGLDPDQQHMLSVTARNVARLRSLIEDLLTLDRAEHSGTAMEEIDLVDVVTHAVSDLRLSATNQSVDVRLTVPSSPVIALADPGQLQRAVMNLISNAVKFSETGDVVEVSLARQGDNAVILVDDEGIGVPRADLTKLGSRFFRASNAVRSEISGTGLGLRIVQTIVTNHHGTLSLDSVEGEGTTVRIVLPLRPTPVDDGPPAAPAAVTGVLADREETAPLDG
jgi:signal transduction histidine kinase